LQNLNEILKLDEKAENFGKKYTKKRELYDLIMSKKGKHFSGIVGPRGVGKTVLLKQLRCSIKNSIYISLDSVEDVELFELTMLLSERYGFKTFLLDEIHFVKEYARELKKIFDFLDIMVVFSSSVSLSLYKSSYDLSRRVLLLKLFPFSFREYLYFKKDIQLPQLTIHNIIHKEWSPEHLRYDYIFDEYLQGGIFPFSLEEPDVLPLLSNSIKKIIQKDIPSVSSLRVDELSKIDKTLTFIGKSSVDGINYSTISKNIGITKYKAEAYVSLLEKAFLLNVVLPKGTNVLREPKILMYLPFRLLFQEYKLALGGLREDFFAEVMKANGLEFHYLKTTRGSKTPDFLVTLDDKNIIIEIGGKGKGREQFKGIDLKKSLILTHPQMTDGIKRPLSLFGYL
jgi:predicted AAA+ superfamily ATPase